MAYMVRKCITETISFEFKKYFYWKRLCVEILVQANLEYVIRISNVFK